MKRLCLLLALCLCACQADPPTRSFPDAAPGPDAGPPPDGMFVCSEEGERACFLGAHYTCTRNFEFIVAERDDCPAQSLACDEQLGCVPCVPGTLSCDGLDVVRCNDDGQGTTLHEACDIARGEACVQAECKNLCALATEQRSYEGCRFFAADLDNATVGGGFDAAAQQYAVVVSNPQFAPVDVVVEVNDAPVGAPPQIREVATATIFPADLEVFELERREVDGSTLGGLNDGTHTALTSNAYRVRSNLPIIAYQFNPLDNVGVFSNDASLLLPADSLSGQYTVVGWPQTIADSDLPEQNFSTREQDEDLRAFLTIIGTAPDTTVRVDFGELVVKVLGAGPVPESGPGDSFELTLGEFDVLNLETEGFAADFSGTRIDADRPVVTFVGSEASDVPTFTSLSRRRCCADHLEEQLLPDATLGQNFVLARMPGRLGALNAALPELNRIGDGTTPESPEWVRIVATGPGTTVLETTLPGADARIELAEREVVTLQFDQDFVLSASQPVAVVQAVGSQENTGISSPLPGGDPALLVVPPLEQFRQQYVFLTPDKFAFDFVTIVAEADTTVLLDREPVSDRCQTDCVLDAPAAEAPRCGDFVVHRCPLSDPRVVTEPRVDSSGGTQDDGVHRIDASAPVGVLVYGFDAYVSYAYAAGLNLEFAQ